MDGPQIDPVHAIQATVYNGSPSDGGLMHWEDEEEEDVEMETAGTLTKQLAETAVGVREMSKQLGTLCSPALELFDSSYCLGRTRVHSNIQSVLIVTKARDNRLIKLTRELALYLMLKPRQKGGRGMMIV